MELRSAALLSICPLDPGLVGEAEGLRCSVCCDSAEAVERTVTCPA